MATEPLSLPILDPRSEQELVEKALVRTFEASNGTLNDFSLSSVLRVLQEGLGFSAAEMLYYVNQLPLAILLKFLQNAGVERKLGTAAKALITFTLSQPLSTPFTVPQGFQVVGGTDYSFSTDVALVIPAGGVTGEVAATADQVGSAYNLPAYLINTFTQPLTYLSSVTNLQPATGGSDEETVEEAIARGLNAIRRRNLVTADDYEQEAISIMGVGSVAKAIGLLSGDKIGYQLGAVHVFCLNSDGSQPNTTQLSAIRGQMAPRIQIGTSIYISAIDLLNVDADLVAQISEGQDPNEVAQDLWQAYQEYLAPTAFEVGASVILKEVEYALRAIGGIEYVQSLSLNGLGSNLAMPYRYSLPKAHSLFCTLVSSTETYPILLGAGEDYV